MDRTEALTGCAIERAYVDKGYRGHDAQNPRRVFISGQKRGVFGAIKRELRRRSAIESIIEHLKSEGHLGRCYLKGRASDPANVVLSAVGHNSRRILVWLRGFLCLYLLHYGARSSGQTAEASAASPKQNSQAKPTLAATACRMSTQRVMRSPMDIMDQNMP